LFNPVDPVQKRVLSSTKRLGEDTSPYRVGIRFKPGSEHGCSLYFGDVQRKIGRGTTKGTESTKRGEEAYGQRCCG